MEHGGGSCTYLQSFANFGSARTFIQNTQSAIFIRDIVHFLGKLRDEHTLG